MKIEYHKNWSVNLEREIEYKTYGDKGRGVLVFPSQDQRFYEWEDNGMVDVLSPMIDAGEFRLICCDSIDAETWSLSSGNYEDRIQLHEKWFRYITDELIPIVNNGEKLIVAGCSMGGYHAGNFFFRRPDLFDGIVSLSGLFHADYFFPSYNNELIYMNSPLDFLANISKHNLKVEQYKNKTLIFCCGQGNYEKVTGSSTNRLKETLQRFNLNTWFDIWGKDVSHDFYWWRLQAKYFFDKIAHNGLQKAA
jgi:esterase/lipase superfamily enzyme